MRKEYPRPRSAGKTILQWGGVSLLLLPIFIHAAGQMRQEKTFDTTPNPRIGLSNFIGHVVVKGWDKSQVHAVYQIGSQQMSVEVDQLPPGRAAEKIHFTTRVPDSQAAGQDKTVYYTLEVPKGASLEIRNPEGRVNVEGVQGDAFLDSVGGAISVTDVAGHLSVSSVAGDIDIIRPAGRVEATSICGNLHFVSPTGSALKGQTSSGKIRYEGDFVSGGEYSFTNYSGNIDLFVPAAASFELDKNTVSGHFASDLPTSTRPHSLPTVTGTHTFLGSNVSSTAAVRLRSFSGDIRIHRQAADARQ